MMHILTNLTLWLMVIALSLAILWMVIAIIKEIKFSWRTYKFKKDEKYRQEWINSIHEAVMAEDRKGELEL